MKNKRRKHKQKKANLSWKKMSNQKNLWLHVLIGLVVGLAIGYVISAFLFDDVYLSPLKNLF